MPRVHCSPCQATNYNKLENMHEVDCWVPVVFFVLRPNNVRTVIVISITLLAARLPNGIAKFSVLQHVPWWILHRDVPGHIVMLRQENYLKHRRYNEANHFWRQVFENSMDISISPENIFHLIFPSRKEKPFGGWPTPISTWKFERRNFIEDIIQRWREKLMSFDLGFLK